MAQPPQSPLPAFARTLFALDEDLKRRLEHNYDFIYAFVTDMHEEWRRFQLVCSDIVSAAPGDDATITFDIANFTANAIDSTWNDADYNTCLTRFRDFVTAVAPLQSGHCEWTTLKAYRMSWNPGWAGSSTSVDLNPFNPSTTPEFEAMLNVSGSGAASLPPQVAISVTEEVPLRRHWGRFYLPFPSGATVASGSGRVQPSSVDAIALATYTLYNGLSESEMYPIVPHTQHDKTRVASYSQVIAVKVDDVYDVIRSRRLQNATYSRRYTPSLQELPAEE